MAHDTSTASAPLPDSSAGPRPTVDLALQGGGSHGAFTWGVLDRLLDDDGLDIAAISGTSAGALNGAVMLSGYARGHAEGGPLKARREAQLALAAFWEEISQHGPIFSPLTMQAGGALKPAFNLSDLPGYQLMNMFMRTLSPYDFNPLNLNPLRQVVQRHVDIDALHTICTSCGVQLFVTATSVHTGQSRVFTKDELTLDALMASTCLPFLFQAVEIEGEPYWDGGYTGNPALFPLIYNTQTNDLLLVKINPLKRLETPTRSVEILDRLSEITFNASLISELRAIAFVARLLKDNRLDPKQYRGMHLHMIGDDEGLAPYNASSKSNTDRAFLKKLHSLGHAAATRWLHAHKADIGARSTLDVEHAFLGAN